jgi:hypothetical protein
VIQVQSVIKVNPISSIANCIYHPSIESCMERTDWHDINEPSISGIKKAAPASKSTAQSLADDGPVRQQSGPAEIRLIKTEWLPGKEGFQFNKECTLQVEAEYLDTTVRKRLVGDLFVNYNGQEEDLLFEVQGFLNDQGIASLPITLFYGKQYHKDLQSDPAITCQYLLKNINNSACEKPIDSVLLDMPNDTVGATTGCTIVFFEGGTQEKLPDVKFSISGAKASLAPIDDHANAGGECAVALPSDAFVINFEPSVFENPKPYCPAPGTPTPATPVPQQQRLDIWLRDATGAYAPVGTEYMIEYAGECRKGKLTQPGLASELFDASLAGDTCDVTWGPPGSVSV